MHMHNSIGRIRRLAVLAGTTLTLATTTFALPATAAESSQWKAKAVLVVTSGKVVKLTDQTDHEAGLQEYDGVAFSIGDTPFLDNARYQIVSFFDSGGLINGGYKTFTAEDGVVHMQFKVTGGTWPKVTGEWTATGGTQRYKGITGSGTFTSTYVSDAALWDVLEGDYKIP
jgi:hypothetical protein